MSTETKLIMKLAFTCALLIVSISTIASDYSYRPLVEEGKMWSYNLPSWSSATYAISGDTAIQDRIYKKLLACFEPQYGDSLFHYCLAMREDQRKVYVLTEEMEHEELLYDFNFCKGDTLWGNFYSFAQAGCPLGVTYRPGLPEERPWYTIVTNVDTIEVRGSLYRRIEFSSTSVRIQPYTYWIEGIGCEWGLLQTFPYSGFAMTDSPMDIYRCFMSDGDLLFTRPDFYDADGMLWYDRVWEYTFGEDENFCSYKIDQGQVFGRHAATSIYTEGWKYWNQTYRNVHNDMDPLFHIAADATRVYAPYEEYKAYLAKKGYDVSRLRETLPYEVTQDGMVVLYDFGLKVGDKIHAGVEDCLTVVEQHYVGEPYMGKTARRDWIVLSDGSVIFRGLGYVGGGPHSGTLFDWLMPSSDNISVSRLTFSVTQQESDYTYDDHRQRESTSITPHPSAISVTHPLYDLQGRRLTAPPAKGIYVKDGRKVVRK